MGRKAILFKCKCVDTLVGHIPDFGPTQTAEASDFQQGDTIFVILKNAFTEETPFYYPIVYEIRLTNN